MWVIMGKPWKNIKIILACVGARTTIGLIRVVLAVIVPVADVGRVGADARTTLELARSAFELSYGDKTQHIINQNKQNNDEYYHDYCRHSTIITHGSQQAHRSDPRSRPQCHTSTKTECTCHFCKQTERDRREKHFFFFSS